MKNGPIEFRTVFIFMLIWNSPIKAQRSFNREKMDQEKKSLVHTGDSFKKIIIVKDRIKLWRNEEGIVIMGIMDFLLNPNSLEL